MNSKFNLFQSWKFLQALIRKSGTDGVQYRMAGLNTNKISKYDFLKVNDLISDLTVVDVNQENKTAAAFYQWVSFSHRLKISQLCVCLDNLCSCFGIATLDIPFFLYLSDCSSLSFKTIKLHIFAANEAEAVRKRLRTAL